MSAAADAVRVVIDRIARTRRALAAGEDDVAQLPVVYAELTDLYVAARRSLERTETQLHVLKERI